MTKKQYNYARIIIKADCQTTEMMVDCGGNTCAVGALAAATYVNGVKAPAMKELAGKTIGAHAFVFRKLARRIEKMFGLDTMDLGRIIGANDRIKKSIPARRRSVLNRLQKIARNRYKLNV